MGKKRKKKSCQKDVKKVVKKLSKSCLKVVKFIKNIGVKRPKF
jgi:hypothetical protein